MKGIKLTAYLVCLFTFTTFAQAPQWLQKSTGGSEGFGCTTDLWGNVIVAGTTTGTSCNFGPIILGGFGFVSHATVVVKYDNAGNILWATNTTGGNAYTMNVITDRYGFIYVSGYYTSPALTVGPYVLVNPVLAEDVYFIAKYDPSGNVIWAKNLCRTTASPIGDWAPITTDGTNLYFGESFVGTSINLGPFNIVNADPSGNTEDLFLAKLDTAGNFLWAKHIGGATKESPGGIFATRNGTIYYAGSFGTAPCSFGAVSLSAATPSMFVAKFDSSGNAIWANKYGGNGEFISFVTADKDDNVFFCGIYPAGNPLAFGPFVLPAVTTQYGFLTRLDSSGNVAWAKPIEGRRPTPWSATTDDCGNIWVGGGAGIDTCITLDTHTLCVAPPGIIQSDLAFIYKLRTDGTYISGTLLPTLGEDVFLVAADHLGNLFAGGDYNIGPFIIGTDTLFDPAGNECMLTLKFNITPPDTTFLQSAVCGTDSVTLTAPAGFADYIWNDGLQLPSRTVAPPGDYWVYCFGKCESPAIIDTFHLLGIDEDTLHSSSDTTLCLAAGVTLQAPPGYTKWHWNTGDTTSQITADAEGAYWVMALSDCTTSIDTTTISVVNYVFDVGPDDTVCLGTPSKVSFIVPPPHDPVSVRWSPARDIADTNSAITRIVPDTPGLHIYTVSLVDAFGCGGTDTVSVFVLPPLQLTISPPAATIEFGSSLQLEATSPPLTGTLIYTWAPNDGTLNNPNINNPVATPIRNTSYAVYAMTPQGCRDTAHTLIELEYPDDFLPTSFTPNGDGRNDIFRLYQTRGLKLISFEVYNRWGERVYSNYTDPTRGWDGTYQGVPQGLGVYNYMVIVARTAGDKKILKGNVTLIR